MHPIEPHRVPRANERWIGLPESYEKRIAQQLSELGTELTDARAIAASVLKLSDHYLNDPLATTPWHQKWAQIAYLAYFFPLNFARAAAVAGEATRLGFFADLEHIYDFGSGSGAALFAMLEEFKPAQTKVAFDVDSRALEFGLKLRPEHLPAQHTTQTAPTKFAPRTLLLSSYTLTELQSDATAWEAGWLDCEALVLIEPSTQADGRALMKRRADLVAHGFHIWAPCTHAQDCPLLAHSERDWCHDRIHWKAPPWMLEVEKHLPMKNRTLTFSYLLARKSLPSPLASHNRPQALARLTGDLLPEKGKTRQSVCRGSEREFLAWFPQRLPKETAALFDFQRGNLVELKDGLTKKASEVRLTQPDEISEILPGTKI